jgi:hypothetical protein
VNAHGLPVEICDMNDTTKSFDADLKLTAAGLRRKLADHDFCLALLVMKEIFETCNAASEYLQNSSIDFLAAIDSTKNLRLTLRSYRNEQSFGIYEKQVADLFQKINIVNAHEDNEPLKKDNENYQ